MHDQPERSGVSGSIAALVAIIALVFGLLSGIVLGGAGGYLLASRTDTGSASLRIAIDSDGPLGKLLDRGATTDDELAESRSRDEAGSATDAVPGDADTDTRRGDRPRAFPRLPSDRDPGTQAGEEPSEEDAGTAADATPGGDGAAAAEQPGDVAGEPSEAQLRPLLGVRVQTAGLGVGEFAPEGGDGALVVGVDPDTPAEEAGLQAGDVIVAIDDLEITTADALVEAVAEYSVGDTVVLTVQRDDAEIEVEAVLAGQPRTQSELPMNPFPNLGVMPFDPDDPGFQQFREQLPPELRDQLEQMLEELDEGSLYERFDPLPPPDAEFEDPGTRGLFS